MFWLNIAIQAVPSACSSWPPVGPGGQQDCLRAARGDHAKNDAQDVDQAVLPAQDHIAQPVSLPVLRTVRRRLGGGSALA
jgi:hypothetical protein